MSIIRVNPDSVRAYGRTASGQFEQMRAALERLTHDVVAVRYFGPNATAFKTAAGTMAVEFANALITDLNGIAEAVRASTSSISASLGGAGVDIVFDGSPVAMPDVPAATDVVDIDTSALEALRPVVTQHFATLQAALSEHLRALQSTDWEGTAKLGAVDAVTTFTNSGRTKAEDAQRNLHQAIDDQISAVLAADR